MIKRKLLRINPEICMGCKICEMVCALAHANGSPGIKPQLSVIKIKDNPEKGIYMPSICRFCDEAPCLDACPLNALYLDEKTGITMVDEEECIGCGLCMDACEFGAIRLHPDKNIAIVCDLCKGDPECVKYCTQEALSYE